MTPSVEHRLVTECAYALINPLRVDKHQWQDFPHIALMPAGLDAQAEQMPVLLLLKNLTPEQRLTLLERTQYWAQTHDQAFFSILINSTASVEHTVHCLNRNLLLRAPGAEFSLLRYYDSMVFQHLRWVLTPVQLATLMAPADAWYWQDTDGQWQREERPELKTLFMVLQSKQVETLGRIGVINRTLKWLRCDNPNLIGNIPFLRQLDVLLERAYQKGLSEEADVQLFVRQAMSIHPEIHQHPKLLSCLNEVRAGDCTYVSACLNVDNDELQAWVHRNVLTFKETR
jgi:hypothetical protein